MRQPRLQHEPDEIQARKHTQSAAVPPVPHVAMTSGITFVCLFQVCATRGECFPCMLRHSGSPANRRFPGGLLPTMAWSSRGFHGGHQASGR